MRTVIDVMYTGEDPNLVNREFLPIEWQDRIRPAGNVGLRSDTNQAVQVEALVLSHVRLGDLSGRAWFGGVKIWPSSFC